MISAIIDTLNTKLSLLTYFEKRYCLTELKTETKGETEVTSPVHYVGSSDWEKIQVDKYRGVSYWRKDGEVSVERVDELGNAKDFVSVTFPLKLVGYVKREDTTIDDEYSPDRVANALTKQLNFKNGELKTTLKAKRVISTVTDYSTNSAEIWEEETSGTGKVDVPFKFAVVSLSLDVEVLARIDCLETECDQDSDILHAFNFCLPSVRDRLTDAQVTCLTDALCPPCDPATVELNGVEMADIASGDTENISVRQSSGATEVGSKQGQYWRIDDSAISVNGSPVADVKAEDALDIDVTQDGSPVGSWNGSAWIIPSCPACASIEIGVYSDSGYTNPITSAEINNTIYLRAENVSGITPVTYEFIFVDVTGLRTLIYEGANDNTSWIVSGNIGEGELYILATEEVTEPRTWVGQSKEFELLLDPDPDAEAWLTAVGINNDSTVYNLTYGVTGSNLWQWLTDFYLQLKAETGLYEAIHAMYLPIGNNANIAKINMVDPRDLDLAFRVTWAGGVVFNDEGVVYNGTNSYGDTHFVSSVHLAANDGFFAEYKRTTPVGGTFGADWGASSSASVINVFKPKITVDRSTFAIGTAEEIVTGVSTAIIKGFQSVNRNNNASLATWKGDDGTTLGTDSTSFSLHPSFSIALGAVNSSGTILSFAEANTEIGFNIIADGLTSSQETALRNAVKTLMTNIGWNV